MKRILELDALRGVTALVICLAHLGAFGKAEWVFTAVDLFFVISGYFITMNLLRDVDSPKFFRKFFARRILRIWPAYYLAFVACLILNRSLKWDVRPDGWLYYLTFTQNIQQYWGGAVPKFSLMFIHTWTLAIEEQFYLLWPFLMLAARRRRLPLLAAVFVVVPILSRAAGVSPYLLLTRCDGLALGGMLAWLFTGTEKAWPHWKRDVVLWTSGLAAFAGWVALRLLAGRFSPEWLASLEQFRACVFYFAAVGLTLNHQGRWFLAPLRIRRLCDLGAISYGLYLYHPLVFGAFPRLYERFVVDKLGLTSPTLKDAAMLAICFLIASASRKYFEEPILALKRRFRTSTLSVAEPWRVDEGHDVRETLGKMSATGTRNPGKIEPPSRSAASSRIATEVKEV